MCIDACWCLVHLALNNQLTTHSVDHWIYITTAMLLLLPIFILTSFSLIVTLTSTLVPFRLTEKMWDNQKQISTIGPQKLMLSPVL